MSKLIFGAAIAAVSIASPALAQYASRIDQQISVHHRQHLRLSSHPSDSPALASPLETPGLGLVIQHGDRMFMFQAWPKVSNC